MTDKDLRKLNRAELLELLLEQSRRCEALEEELSEAKKQLADRAIRIREAGNLAEASLALTGIFEDAQKAAELYLSNVRILTGHEQPEEVGTYEAEDDGIRFEEVGTYEAEDDGIRFEEVGTYEAEDDDIRFEEVGTYEAEDDGIRFEEVNMYDASGAAPATDDIREDDIVIEEYATDETAAGQDAEIEEDIKTWIRTHQVEPLAPRKIDTTASVTPIPMRKSVHKKAKPVKPALTRKVKNIQ